MGAPAQSSLLLQDLLGIQAILIFMAWGVILLSRSNLLEGLMWPSPQGPDYGSLGRPSHNASTIL